MELLQIRFIIGIIGLNDKPAKIKIQPKQNKIKNLLC